MFEKAHIRRDFNKAAAYYHEKARIQREVARHLFDSCAALIPAHARVLDVGAGTGFLCEFAREAGKEWDMVQLDLAENMCRAARAQTGSTRIVNGDIDHLPFASEHFDAVLSSLTFQWLPAPERSFAELFRVLKPGREFFVSSFGPDTLKELRDAFMKAEGEDRRVNRFLSFEHLRRAAYGAGFDHFFSEVQERVDYHPDARSVMEEIRGIGASNKLSERSRALSGKGRFEAMERHYPATERGLPLTWEIFYISAQRPA